LFFFLSFFFPFLVEGYFVFNFLNNFSKTQNQYIPGQQTDSFILQDRPMARLKK